MPFEEVAVSFSEAQQGPSHRVQDPLQRETKKETEAEAGLRDCWPVNIPAERSNHQERPEQARADWISQSRAAEGNSQGPQQGKATQNQPRPKTQQGNHARNRVVVPVSSVTNNNMVNESPLLQAQKMSSTPSGEGFIQCSGESASVQERPYHTCPICGKTFSQSSHLIFHQRIHDVEKPYKCTQCGSSFHSRQGLIYHQRSHAGEKPYKCSFCGKTFSQSSHLLVHKRSHTGEKPFKCPSCGKCFSRNSLLTIHERTHTGEKPYKCSQCGSRFHSGSGLINHKRIHAGVKPYKCTVCGRDFIRKAHLIRHQSVHSDDKANS